MVIPIRKLSINRHFIFMTFLRIYEEDDVNTATKCHSIYVHAYIIYSSTVVRVLMLPFLSLCNIIKCILNNHLEYNFIQIYIIYNIGF